MKLKLAALQLPTLSMSEARIDYYLRYVKSSGARLVLLGEYNLNSFFSELIKMPKSLIKEQIFHKTTLMSELSKKYDMAIIAPIILEKSCSDSQNLHNNSENLNDDINSQKTSEFVKGVMKFTPDGSEFYEQNLLINYDHWNEREFFANNSPFKIPKFEFDGFKFAIISGFEIHFDISFKDMLSDEVDCILTPTSCTFNSQERWKELLKVRAFTNLVYILRANRVGKLKLDDKKFDFYGESFLITPFGEIANALEEKEGALVVEIYKEELDEARKIWKFNQTLKEINE